MFHLKSPYERNRRRRVNLLRIETVSSDTTRSEKEGAYRSALLEVRQHVWLLQCWVIYILTALQNRSGNPQLLHLVDQCSALQAKFGGSAFPTADHPPHAFEHVQNQSPLVVLQSRDRCSSGSGSDGNTPTPRRWQRIRKHTIV
jgi:hypothetical protein